MEPGRSGRSVDIGLRRLVRFKPAARIRRLATTEMFQGKGPPMVERLHEHARRLAGLLRTVRLCAGTGAAIVLAAWSGPAVFGSVPDQRTVAPEITTARISSERVEGGAPAPGTSRTGGPPLAAPPWPPRVSRTARASSADPWWPAFAGIALILAIGGGIAAARRFVPAGANSSVQVVGRVSLSPKHSVYLLRVGRRMLLVGAGPQGPPSFISEVDELTETVPDPGPEDAA
jgi:hypothetical protein